MSKTKLQWTFDRATYQSISPCGRFRLDLYGLMNRGDWPVLHDTLTGTSKAYESPVIAKRVANRIARQTQEPRS